MPAFYWVRPSDRSDGPVPEEDFLWFIVHVPSIIAFLIFLTLVGTGLLLDDIIFDRAVSPRHDRPTSVLVIGPYGLLILAYALAVAHYLQRFQPALPSNELWHMWLCLAALPVGYAVAYMVPVSSIEVPIATEVYEVFLGICTVLAPLYLIFTAVRAIFIAQRGADVAARKRDRLYVIIQFAYAIPFGLDFIQRRIELIETGGRRMEKADA